MTHIRIARIQDIDGVIALQDKYLYPNLTDEEREKGFVTVPFTFEQIAEVVKNDGLFIGTDENDKVISYAFTGKWKFFDQWEIFKYMVCRTSEVKYLDQIISIDNSFIYGPVCIHEDYRGEGVLNAMFEAMRIHHKELYPIAVTFINKANVISEKVHTRKIGGELIGEFEYHDNTYVELVFDMNKSVLS